MLLRDHSVIVAGVGPGLGRELALACARHGASVVLAARSEERLSQVAGEVKALGRRALVVAGDLSDPGQCAHLVETARTELGGVDGLVHNAAEIPPFEPVHAQPLEAVRRGIELNLFSGIHLCQALAPVMKERGRGSIVIVGSAVVRHPKLDFGAYNIAKHGLLGLARSLALELGAHGIRVNTLAPGKILGERLLQYFERRAEQRGTTAEVIHAEYAANLALKRIPLPAEYADAAVFLLSELSRTITGHCLDANGGEYFD
jgi:NAD(P)-dependent dehydrogenase (short-subunit alcohol dehydrogenase family)